MTCPFHGNAEWRWLRDNDPDGWREAVAFDKAIRHGYHRAIRHHQHTRDRYFLHRSCRKLDQANLDPPTTGRRLRVVDAGPAEDGDPDGCSPSSYRSVTPVTDRNHSRTAAGAKRHGGLGSAA